MNIQLISDIHVEFYRDRGVAFIKNLDTSKADVLVVAGDLGSANTFRAALNAIAAHVYPTPIVYVLGNHEYYGSHRLFTRGELSTLPPNVRWLDHSHVTLDDVTFFGGTGWFDQRKVKPGLEYQFSDFVHIHGLREWVYVEHAAFRKYLKSFQSPTARSALVTHHAPSPHAVLPRWRRSQDNDFFYVDHEAAILGLKPSVVLHGHMHSGLRYAIDGIQVICNPVGYPNERQELPYDPQCIIPV